METHSKKSGRKVWTILTEEENYSKKTVETMDTLKTIKDTVGTELSWDETQPLRN